MAYGPPVVVEPVEASLHRQLLPTAEQPALVYDSPVAGTKRTYTYRELRDEVARFAGALARLGVERGDRVATFSWNTQEHLEAYLAVPVTFRDPSMRSVGRPTMVS